MSCSGQKKLYGLFCAVLVLFTPSFVAAAAETVTATAAVKANATTTFPAPTLRPKIIYQEYNIGEDNQTETLTNTNGLPTSTYVELGPVATITPSSIAWNVPLNPQNSSIVAYCWYPVSGIYGLLARVLFYVTLLFALLARRHQWLIIGALAASLTYSGVAAINACIIIWSNQATGNNDIYAILGIMSFSASMLVPLLNWSTTIKSLGAEREEDSVGRSVIIYWGCLIFTAFLSLFVGVWLFYSDFNITFFLTPWTSGTDSITCGPQNGTLDLTVDQEVGWNNLYITPPFIDQNACTNPCTTLTSTTILRKTADLQVLTAKQYNHFINFGDVLTKKQRFALEAYNWYLYIGSSVLAWIILQGITAIFFGRRSPSQVRNFVYISLTNLFARWQKPEEIGDITHHRFPHWFAKTTAIMLWLWAGSATVFSIPLVVASIVATEYYMYEIPQNDELFQVDQWAPWVATALVLVAAFAFRFQGMAEDIIVRTLNLILRKLHQLFHGQQCEHYKEAEARLHKDKLKDGSRVVLQDMFLQTLERHTDQIKSWGPAIAMWWHNTWEFLWGKTYERAASDTGHWHLSRHKVVVAESQKTPGDWHRRHPGWLDVDEFISLVRKYDEAHRIAKGSGYKWQPRVIEWGEDEERKPFEGALARDLFHRHRSGRRDYAELPMHHANFNVDHKSTEYNHDMHNVQVTSLSDHPAFRKTGSPDKSTSPSLQTSDKDNNTNGQNSDEVHELDEIHELDGNRRIRHVKRTSTAPVSRFSAHHLQQAPQALTQLEPFQDRRSGALSPTAQRQPRHASTIQVPPRRPGFGTTSRSTSAALVHAHSTSQSFVRPWSQKASRSNSPTEPAEPARKLHEDQPSSGAYDKNLPPLPDTPFLNLSDDDYLIPHEQEGRKHEISPATGSSTLK